MDSFKPGDKVKITGPSISGYTDSIGMVVTLKRGPDRFGDVHISDMKRGSYTNVENLEMVKDMDNLQKGDVLENESHSYDRKVIAVLEDNNETIVVTRDTDDDECIATTTADLEAQGWELKSDLVEMTLSEVAEKMGVDVRKLRIKE